MGKQKQDIYAYLRKCLNQYLTPITDKDYLEKIIVFEFKYRTKYQEPLADQHQEQLITFIAEIAKALPVNSHNLPKSQLERQFAEELCKLSYLFNPPPDISGFLEGQARQVVENATAQPQFFTSEKLKKLFLTGKLLKSPVELEKTLASPLYRSTSCHLEIYSNRYCGIVRTALLPLFCITSKIQP